MLLHQEDSVRKLIMSIGLDDCNPAKTPMQVGLKLPNPSEIKTQEADRNFPYQSVVGQMVWLLNTRLDCVFAINVATRYMGSWDSNIITVAKRIVRYLVGKEKMGLIYRKGPAGERIENAKHEKLKLIFYGDSDHGNKIHDSKSTGGGTGAFGGNIFTFATKTQDVGVSTSTCQAEAGSAKHVCNTIEWVLGLTGEMKVRGSGPATLYQDNKSVIELSKNPIMHKRSKHFRIGLHYIQDLVEREVIKFEYCPTAQMLADILTKALPEQAHWELLKLAGFGEMK